jgi:hypothetical protein
MPGGVTITTIGADHYFQAPDRNERTVTLFLTVLDLVGRHSSSV